MQLFVPFLLVLFLIAAVLRVDFFFTIVYLMFGVYVLGRLWTQHTTGRLRFQRRFVNRAFPDEQVVADLTVHNTGWLPIPWLEIHESLPVDLAAPPFYREVISLGLREQRRFRYTLHCRRRGYYAIGPLTVRTGDLLGIGRPTAQELAAEPLIIYPRIVPLGQLGLPTHSPLVALPAKSPLFEDPARVMGVRDYRWGDSPRRIHWTATASTGKLLVKRYQPSIARETMICLDLNRENYGTRQRYMATELAIVVAASIAHHIIIEERLPVGLATEAYDPIPEKAVQFCLPPGSKRAHLMSLLEVLARVQTVPTGSFADLLRRNSVKLSWGATLVVIAGQVNEALLDHLVYLRQAGFALSLILVQPGHRPADLEAQANLLNVPVHCVWREHDLKVCQ